ncbi:cyclin dependent kinase A-like protein [Cryptosporidium canis]|uniref:Cyclin-dependent kinase 2 homolog n=1 Tax=Cryptosporidium canis TaxID=195482 RepID=A0ABQ8P998_9CRYT|nr:cyclin dependent kinase A-like protein [Cryptosporidium canis]KAJ1613207.1 cyclin dependent kinase A-like protein [Cryptosporidium canis]
MFQKLIWNPIHFSLGEEEPDESSVEDYENLEIIGEGTYGVVYKCRCKQSGELFAIKTFRNGTSELSTTTLREISILREVSHPNIVSVQDVLLSSKSVSIVFEFFPYDLKRYLSMFPEKVPPIKFIKHIIFQILNGIFHLHICRIIHRDLKPQNILIGCERSIPDVKIADFGLSRVLSTPFKTLTREVVTLWYRAPEILLGERNYSSSVDIWSIGCIFIELLIGRPIFSGDSEISTLYKIFQTLGTPTPKVCKYICSFPNYSSEWPKWKINENWIDQQISKFSPTKQYILEPAAKNLIKM